MSDSDFELEVEKMVSHFEQEDRKRQIEREARYRYALSLWSEDKHAWDEELKDKKMAFETYKKTSSCEKHNVDASMISHECGRCFGTVKKIYYRRNLGDEFIQSQPHFRYYVPWRRLVC